MGDKGKTEADKKCRNGHGTGDGRRVPFMRTRRQKSVSQLICLLLMDALLLQVTLEATVAATDQDIHSNQHGDQTQLIDQVDDRDESGVVVFKLYRNPPKNHFQAYVMGHAAPLGGT